MAPQPGSFPSQAGSFPGPYQYTRNLPLGRWNLMINGRVYWLQIDDITGTRVSAQLSSGHVGDATWDGVGTASIAGKLSFVRVAGDIKQQFEGWLFQYNAADPLWRMAGTVENISGGEGRSGWYGTLPRE